MLRPATPTLALIGLLSLAGSACTQQLELPGASSATGGASGAGGTRAEGGRAGAPGRGGSGGGQGGSGTSSPVDAVSPDAPDAMSAPNKDASPPCNQLDDVRQMLPQVMVTLDRSSSMWRKPDASTSSRLQIVQRALTPLMDRYHESMRFGYVEFPGARECSTGGCCASTVTPPNTSSIGLIQKQWGCQSGPAGCSETTDDTPIAQALARSRTFYGNPAQNAGPGSRHVLLLTDGEPACAANVEKNDCSQAINEVNTLIGAHKVWTRVIGLTEELRTSTCLETMATLGAPAVAGQPPTGHVIATDEDRLYDEVNKWLSVLSKEACSFRLPKLGESPGLRVRFRGTNVPPDINHINGWDVDAPDQPTRITFYGPACTNIRDHGDDDVSFLICAP